MKVFHELRRRSVFRVAGLYAVVSWLLIQIVVAIKAPLGLPAWTDTFFIVLLGVGFPVALVLAWAFEVTPDGIKFTKDVPESESVSAQTGRKLDYAILAGLALVAILVVGDRMIPGRTAAPATGPKSAEEAGVDKNTPTETSIAVLPFVDMSASGDEEYFSDGISEEILNVLAQMPGLKVAGRTSSFSFKGKNEELTTIGKALGVANILEGSVRKQGERVRITAQLIKASDGFHLWSQTYDRNLTDIFAVQDEISAAIADALAMKITKRSGPALVDHIDPQAYDIYLRARQLFATRNPDSMRQAVSLFDAVTVLAPEFDMAWSGAARADSLYTSYNGGVDVGYYIARSESAAAKALALNPENAEAHSVIAINAGSQDFDLNKAVEETRLAIEYAPNDAEIANFAGDAYRYAADFKNAFIWEKRALDLNPLQPINHLDLGFLYYAMGHCKESAAEFEATLKADRGQGLAYGGLAVALLCVGDIKGAHAAADKYAKLAPDDPVLIDTQVRVAVAESRLDDARKLVATLKRRAEKGDEVYYFVAQEECLLHDYAVAAQSIRRAVAARDWNFASDYIWFVPEDWPDDPRIQAALNEPELKAMWEIRRKNLAAFPREGTAD